MKITVDVLVKMDVSPSVARLFVEPLAEACARFDIDSVPRIAGFLAQCVVETGGFTQLEESLYYRNAERLMAIWPRRFTSLQDAAEHTRRPAKLANRVYANRLGNGNEASGDGWKYRGRGIKQLTGLDNYRAAEVALGRPYVEHPDLVALPEDACLTGAWFWHVNKLNILADTAQWDAITRTVNGPGMLKADLRRQLAEDGIQAL